MAEFSTVLARLSDLEEFLIVLLNPVAWVFLFAFPLLLVLSLRKHVKSELQKRVIIFSLILVTFFFIFIFFIMTGDLFLVIITLIHLGVSVMIFSSILFPFLYGLVFVEREKCHTIIYLGSLLLTPFFTWQESDFEVLSFTFLVLMPVLSFLSYLFGKLLQYLLRLKKISEINLKLKQKKCKKLSISFLIICYFLLLIAFVMREM